jgi:lipooligosaccharide transport system permease protein
VWKVWQRNFDVFLKTITSNFLPSLLEPILYLLALGVGLGVFIQPIEGVPYINFIAPALVAISVMNGSFFECTFGSFVRMYYQKTFDAIIATPVSVEEVIAGELVWGATRATINSTTVLAVIAAFGLISSPLFLLVPLLAFLGGLMFASIAMCFTALAPNIDFFNYPSFLFITPMFLLSGTFFPLSQLPLPVQTAAQVFLPLTHVVNIVRGLVLGRTEIFLLISLVWIAVVTIFFFVLSINLMKKRLIK